MVIYIVKRLIISLGLIFLLSFVSFVMIDLPPGDYLSTFIATMEASGLEVEEAEIQRIVQLYKLDQPLLSRYFSWMEGIITRGDFGRSLVWNRHVSEILAERLPSTILISTLSLLVVWVVALPIGFYSARNQYSPLDYVATIIGFVGLAIPNFLIALVAVWVMFRYFDVTITGLFSPEYQIAEWSVGRFLDMLSNIWVPVLIIGLSGTASLIRILRGNLLDELNKQYVVTARAKGLSETTNLLKYPVRMAINPALSTIGWTLPAIVSGEVLVSIVMNLETLGPVLLTAVLAQDMYLAGSIVLILSSLTVIGTMISDWLLVAVDPRIRIGG